MESAKNRKYFKCYQCRKQPTPEIAREKDENVNQHKLRWFETVFYLSKVMDSHLLKKAVSNPAGIIVPVQHTMNQYKNFNLGLINLMKFLTK